MERRVLRFALALLICASGVWAQTFSVKGVLRDPGGRTVDDGTFKMEFRLYEAETGGTKVWSEIQADVPVQHGVFSAELGVVQPLAGVSFLNPLFLGIAVEGHPEMAPRIKILPGPYSMAVLGVHNRFPSTGNVGVATTSPTEPLEVAGNLKLSNGGVLIFPDNSSLASADLGGTASSAASPGNLLLTADDDATGDGAVQLRTGSATQVTITAAGDVGIGTATPASKLSVAGNADFTGPLGIGTSAPANPLSVAGDADISGNLAIGTTTTLGAQTPGADLALAGMGSMIELGRGVADKNVSAGQIGFRVHSDALDVVGAGSAQARRLKFWAEQGAAFTGPLAVANGAIPGAGVGLNVGGGVNSYFDSPGIVGGSMTIDGTNRRVGIGTATPANPLSVAGNADISGNLGIGTATPNVNLAIAGVGATIELGAGVADKEANAGRIGYRRYTDALDIVGGGTNQARRITFWAEQGSTFHGRVGIGTYSPRAALHVAYGITNNVGAYAYLNSSQPTGMFNGSINNPYAIWSEGYVAATEFNAFSDVRIKKVIGTSDSQQDLETLQALEVTDYTYIDVVAKGTETQKKLIAQQVQEVYPRAVSQSAEFIPSVYQMSASTEFANGLLRIFTEKEHGFAAADTVRLIFDEGYEERVVRQVVDAHTFAVDCEEAVERVFVWGKKVDDFLTVDYEAIAMLNVSATQELARQMADLSARTEALAQENAQLKAQVASLAAAEAEKAALEARLTHMEDTVVRMTTALQRFEEKDGATSGQVLLKVPSATLAQSR